MIAIDYKNSVYNQNGEKVKELELNPALFGMKVKEAVVHQVAVGMLANQRRVIADTKDKGEVRGGGKKPWKQKGTGRARHGSIRSPLWRGGGIIFGPTTERNFSKKINKKMKRKALLMCLSDKFQNNNLVLLDDLALELGKTKELVNVIKNLKTVLNLAVKAKKIRKSAKKKGTAEEKEWLNEEQKTEDNKEKVNFDWKDYKISVLLVLPGADKKVFLASGNLAGLKAITADSLNVLDLLRYKKVLLPVTSLEVLEKNYLKKLK